MYLLVCSYSLDWKTEKCLEMGWNCQNTLGSSVSYRILRESKCFTLSRFEKWVSYVPTGLFVFSGLENRKMSRNGLKLSKYVRKYCFLSHTSRIEMFYSFKIWEVGFVGTGLFVCLHCQNTLGSSVSYRIPTGLYLILWIGKPKNRIGLKLSKYVRKYCFLSHTSRIEMFYSFKGTYRLTGGHSFNIS